MLFIPVTVSLLMQKIPTKADTRFTKSELTGPNRIRGLLNCIFMADFIMGGIMNYYA